MWAGKLNLHAGNHLVAVEYDTASTAEALRARCAEWSTDDTADIPAAFGLRVAKVGFRRRKVAVVHYGAPVRYRLDGLTAGIEAIATMLSELGRDVPDGSVEVSARAFVRDGVAALLDVPLSVDLDERPIRAAGIDEVPTLRPLLDLSTGRVTVGGRSVALAGAVVAQPGVAGLDSARRQVFDLGIGPRLPWAEFVDRLEDRIVFGVERDAVTDAVDQLLRRDGFDISSES